MFPLQRDESLCLERCSSYKQSSENSQNHSINLAILFIYFFTMQIPFSGHLSYPAIFRHFIIDKAQMACLGVVPRWHFLEILSGLGDRGGQGHWHLIMTCQKCINRYNNNSQPPVITDNDSFLWKQAKVTIFLSPLHTHT